MPLLLLEEINDLDGHRNPRDSERASAHKTAVAFAYDFSVLDICLEDVLVTFACQEVLAAFLVNLGSLLIENHTARSPTQELQLNFVAQIEPMALFCG